MLKRQVYLHTSCYKLPYVWKFIARRDEILPDTYAGKEGNYLTSNLSASFHTANFCR